MRTRARITLAGVVLGAALIGGVAWASIPNDAGVYTACKLNATGTIRLIDPSLASTSLLSHCTSLETQITWNQKGQKGEPGTNGTNGRDGTNGTNGTNGIDGKDGAKGDPCLPTDPACVGPQGPAGTSELWASVGQAGVLIGHGSGVTATNKLASHPGVYFIQFDRNVSSCALIATPTEDVSMSVHPGGLGPDPTQVTVSLWSGADPTPNFVDAAFSISVSC